jgi:glycosyltransferase involved in cell wall biosynthesis
MRVAIIGSRGIPSTYSGFETFVGELAPRLAERGHDVTVYCRRSLFDERPSKYQSVNLAYIPSIEHKLLSTVTHSFVSLLHACLDRFDVVFVVNVVNGWFGLIPRILNSPSAINVDGLEWLRPKWGPIPRAVFRTGAKLACRWYNSIVVDSVAMGEFYGNEFGANSTFIPYGADVGESLRPEVISQYGLDPNRYFLVVGRRIPDNNADVIIREYVASASQYPLVVVGSADYRGNKAEVQFYRRLLELSDDRVRFLGHVSDREALRELWCNCYVYLHGHEYGGTNPTLLQALGYGCCIAALDTPFSREVLDEGRFGFFFSKRQHDLEALLTKLLAEPELVAGYRSSAQRRVIESYSWDDVAERYEQLFAEVAKSSNDRSTVGLAKGA